MCMDQTDNSCYLIELYTFMAFNIMVWSVLEFWDRSTTIRIEAGIKQCLRVLEPCIADTFRRMRPLEPTAVHTR